MPIIPNHTETQLGAYILQKYERNKLGAEAGIRLIGKIQKLQVMIGQAIIMAGIVLSLILLIA